MYKLMILIILSIMAVNVSTASDLQWDSGTTHKFYSNDEFVYNDYMIKVTVLPSPVKSKRYEQVPSESVQLFVGLNITKNGKFVDSITLLPSQSYIAPDKDIKITVESFPSTSSTEWLYESYKPWVILKIQKRGTPKLSVYIETDKSKYTPNLDKEIISTIKFQNTGSADVINLNAEITTQLQLEVGDLKYHFDKIKNGETIVKTIKLSIPSVSIDRNYKISINTTWQDAIGKSYTSKSQKTITISPEPIKTVIVKKTTLKKIYLKDMAMISLIVQNQRDEELKNVEIKDKLPEGFKLVGNHSMTWVTNISAKGEWEERYLIKPLIPNKNGITIPSAIVKFKIGKEVYSVKSNESKIIVYGPRVILTKTTNLKEVSPNSNVRVTITAENKGSTPTRIFIYDSIPKGAKLVSGLTAYEDYLEAGRKISFTYTIKIGSNLPLKLPECEADYFELGDEGGKIHTKSQSILLKKKIPKIKKTPKPTKTMISTPTPTPKPTPIVNKTVKPVKKKNIYEIKINDLLFNTMLDCRNTKYNITRFACELLMNQNRNRIVS